MDAIRVPEGTTEITYTGLDGAQVSIPVKAGKKGTLAHPETSTDLEVLAGFGWTGDTAPADPADTEGPGALPTAEEG